MIKKLILILTFILLSGLVLADCSTSNACYNQKDEPFCSPDDGSCVYKYFVQSGYSCVTSESEADSDGDGWSDSCDAFVNDFDEHIDLDGDGSGHNSDCNDMNPDIGTTSKEICDNDIDDDCDGEIDNCISIVQVAISEQTYADTSPEEDEAESKEEVVVVSAPKQEVKQLSDDADETNVEVVLATSSGLGMLNLLWLLIIPLLLVILILLIPRKRSNKC